MITIRSARCMAGAVTLAALLGTLACGHAAPGQVLSPMAQRNAQLDLLGQQAGTAGLDGSRRTTLSYEAWLHSADGE
jgi:hypothetical protein